VKPLRRRQYREWCRSREMHGSSQALSFAHSRGWERAQISFEAHLPSWKAEKKMFLLTKVFFIENCNWERAQINFEAHWPSWKAATGLIIQFGKYSLARHNLENTVYHITIWKIQFSTSQFGKYSLARHNLENTVQHVTIWKIQFSTSQSGKYSLSRHNLENTV